MIKNPTYKYYFGKNTVVAVSSFAGKTVRGVAKCGPNDEFDIEKGKKLARARCARKIAEKRYKRALKKCDEAQQALNKATSYFGNMERYFGEASATLNEAYFHEAALKASM